RMCSLPGGGQSSGEHLGWKKGYEEESKIGITGIAEKVSKDPDGYCKLQSHVLEQNTFIGKWLYLDWNPTLKKILMVLLAIYPSLMMPHPSHFPWGEFVFPDDSCGIKFTGFNSILEWPGKPLNILT
ncbi:hypothetical protein VP01_7509g1, partial [Puccinia sorghi]